MNATTDRNKAAALPDVQNDYYVQNFHTLCGYVVKQYSDLLTSEEKQWYATLCSLSDQAQRLYIRLLNRKSTVFRLSRLDYADINPMDVAALELSRHQLASCEPPQELSVLLSVYTKPELIAVLSLKEQRNLSRPALLDHIEQYEDEMKLGIIANLQREDRWISLGGHAHWMLMQLCFFGNLYQDSSEFVISQLGNMSYADYCIEPSARAFTSREQIDAHWRYFECATLFAHLNKRDVVELVKLSQMLPAYHRKDNNLIRRVDRLRVSIARQLEKLHHADAAMSLYKQCINPPSRERQVRLLGQEGNWVEAHQLAQRMLDSPLNEAELLVAQRLTTRCKKELGQPFSKLSPYKPPTSTLVLTETPARVEEQAREYFATSGRSYYTENTLITGVLGLFIWDIVFHPIPGVFYNPFQIAPADFHQVEFCQRRRVLLDDRFRELASVEKLQERIFSVFEQQFGKQNPLVRWHSLSVELLDLAVTRIPLEHWRAMFDRILLDTRENSKGFPDLVHFPDEGGYELIEIKGPGDTLQANQRRWMKYFDQFGISCRVVNVRYRVTHKDSVSSDPTTL